FVLRLRRRTRSTLFPYTTLFRSVRVLEGTGLARLAGAGKVASAVLADGTELPADLVIVGIGILPDTDLAEAAGIALENGIRADEDRKSTRLNSSHVKISYAVFCL